MSDTSITTIPALSKTREEFLEQVRKHPEARVYLKTVQERVQRGYYFDSHNDDVVEFCDDSYIVLNVAVPRDGTTPKWRDNEEYHPVWAFPTTKSHQYNCRNPFMVSVLTGQKYVNEHPFVKGTDGVYRCSGEGHHEPYSHDLWITTSARGQVLRREYDEYARCNPMKEVLNGNVVVFHGEYSKTDEWLMAYPLKDFIAAEF